jgi:hypothetical protein
MKDEMREETRHVQHDALTVFSGEVRTKGWEIAKDFRCQRCMFVEKVRQSRVSSRQDLKVQKEDV